MFKREKNTKKSKVGETVRREKARNWEKGKEATVGELFRSPDFSRVPESLYGDKTPYNEVVHA